MFIGIDIGSISAKIAAVDESGKLIYSDYLYHHGDPVGTVSRLLNGLNEKGHTDYYSICTTGSGRKFIADCFNADLVKNEITAVWKAAHFIQNDVKTIIEIGGQDSKLISLENGEINDFKLNSVCAAGTGSFIEQQANRLGISLQELSSSAMNAKLAAKFTGRCTVFVETEMINLQQKGYSAESIAAGLFDAICENFMNDMASGIRIDSPVMFCGGVSEMEALKYAFEKKIGKTLDVPSINRITAAYGAALLAVEAYKKNNIRNTGLKKIPLKAAGLQDVQFVQCKNSDCLECGLCYAKKP